MLGIFLCNMHLKNLLESLSGRKRLPASRPWCATPKAEFSSSAIHGAFGAAVTLGNSSQWSLRKLAYSISLQVSSLKMGSNLCQVSASNVMNGLLVSVFMSGRSRFPAGMAGPPGENGI